MTAKEKMGALKQLVERETSRMVASILKQP